METQKIEKLDKALYNLWLIRLVGLFIWGGFMIFEQITGNSSTMIYVAQVAGVTILLIGYVMKKIITNKMRNDSKIKQALTNELYILYNYKVYVWGFYVMMFSLLALTYATNMDTESVCLISIFASAITAVTARLVYHHKASK